MIYYHGTNKNFDKFSKKVKPNFTSPQKHLGFFFSDNSDAANLYARSFKFFDNYEGANIKPVYLSFSKAKIEKGSLINDIEENWLQRDAKSYVKKLKEEGYDAIIFKDVVYKQGRNPDIVCDEIVVFEESQIVSIFDK